MDIRIVKPEDAEELLDIYSYYVKNTAITYEYEVPTVEEFAERIRSTLVKYPYLAAVVDGQIVGYIYAGPFHARKAYEHWAEASIYIRRDCRRQGIGSALYDELAARLLLQNVYVICACIASPDEEDEYLTHSSVRFHGRLGFEQMGRFEHCAYKFGRWYNMVYMTKTIAEAPESPDEFIYFSGE